MLSDATLRNIKPGTANYKLADRDGMYATVTPKGTITFRFDYRINGRRETLTIGRYGTTRRGMSLQMARELCVKARRAIAEGRSPSQEKQREKRRVSEAKTFEEFTNLWLEDSRMADSTRSMRKSVIARDIMPAFKNRLLAEVTAEDLRALCDKVKARGAPATAIHVRDIVKQVFAFATLHGDQTPNPADGVSPSSIATFVAKDRALSPTEIRVLHKVLESSATQPTIRLALRLILLTLVRKSELVEATWDEVDFENALWTIPKRRMKGAKAHNVYPRQLQPHGDERRRDRRPHRRRPHLRQGAWCRPGIAQGSRTGSRAAGSAGLGLVQQLRLGARRRHDFQRHRSDVDQDAGIVEQQLLREPVQVRMGTDQVAGRRQAMGGQGRAGDHSRRARPV